VEGLSIEIVAENEKYQIIKLNFYGYYENIK
jgi:hypothetical protein